MTAPILSYKHATDQKHLGVDVEKLIWSKLLIQAGSGYGKSWAVRQLCEEVFGRVPVIIIDPEGEFHTLREKYDFVLAAPRGGDVEATPKTAAILARRLIELSASAVIDIFELKDQDKKRFVRVFLETLMGLPRSLWHPTIVVLDEIQIFAPEKGHGEAESLDAVSDASSRMRKRGFCMVGATQRLSKFHKDVASNLHNKLIGFASLDVDIKRAAAELGFDKDRTATIKQLDPGEFYAYGPAISKEVTLVRTGDVKTTHPEAGSSVAVAAVPPSSRVKKLIESSLADLPKEAEEEARSIEDLRRANAELTRKLKQSEKTGVERVVEKVVVDDRAVKRAVDQAVKGERARFDRLARRVEQSNDTIGLALEKIAVASKVTKDMALELGAESPAFVGNSLVLPQRPEVAASRPRPTTTQRAPRSESGPGDSFLPKGEKTVLAAIAQYPDGAERDQLTVLTGYKRSSRDTYIQRLRERGYIETNGGAVVATDAGISALGSDYEPLPTGTALQEYWLNRLTGGEKKILEVLIEANGLPIARADLDERVGYQRSSRDTYLQRLGSRRLVESVGRGEVRASATLFD